MGRRREGCATAERGDSQVCAPPGAAANLHAGPPCAVTHYRDPLYSDMECTHAYHGSPAPKPALSRWSLFAWAALVSMAWCVALPASAQEPSDDGDFSTLAQNPAAERLRARIELLEGLGERTVTGRTLVTVTALPRFYEARAFEPIWSTGAGRSRLTALLNAVDRSDGHGLDPEAYHRTALGDLMAALATNESEEARTNLELLASDAFLLLGSHLLHGRVNPETIDPEWLANRRQARMDEVLAEAVATDRIEEALFELAPRDARYRAMLDQARSVRAIVDRGGWPAVAPGPRLEVGSNEPRVADLRARLEAEGVEPPPAASGDPAHFDEGLDRAVRAFQERHGLEVDGVVGVATITALNVPAERRLRQIWINLERWRWLPADLGERHIEVNVLGFEVKVVEQGRTVSVHRAVVGRPFRATPTFSGSMTYLVLSPYWHVPPTIAAVDKLPMIRRDPNIITAERMTLLEQGTDRPVDPFSVDWSAMTGAEFNRRYRLRQEPGPNNALGFVKFMFPNGHNVYLHDTPTRSLFDRSSRDFSSGCIRIEGAFDLAEYLLSDRPDWTRERIEQVARAGVERTVPLARAVPVHLLYWTAWMDEAGRPHYRDDIYNRDDIVWRALTTTQPLEQQ